MADLWSGVKNALLPIAQILGNAVLPGIGGPAVALAAKALGLTGDDAQDPKAIEAAILGATPEQRQALIEAENRHEEELVKLHNQEIQMYLQDVQNARQRQIESEKATGKRDVNLYILAWVIIGGFMGLILALIIMQFAFEKVLTADPLITLLLGSLSTDAGMVVGYFFGSSRGSAEKTKLLATKTGGQ